ncbi:CGNR zinc finger domain-containing protein [Actinophytocola sp. KF-1]
MKVVPPFRALDPALAVAERLLPDTRLSTVVRALPDEHIAAARLNDVLAGCGAGPRLRAVGGEWRVVYVAAARHDTELVVAAGGLASLVAVAGWRRLKCCERCGTPFVDRTNGCTRRWCTAHRPHAS